MKNTEHLALFILGVVTLAVTFLLLMAFTGKDTSTVAVVDKQTLVAPAQASIAPQTEARPAPEGQANLDAINRQVVETLENAAAYLARGVYKESEHIAILERLELYAGMSSISPKHKASAQSLINDMNRLANLKESVARKVKLEGQASALETDVQVHLARVDRNPDEARRLEDRLKNLYAVQGLSQDQKNRIDKSLAALRRSMAAQESPKREPAVVSLPGVPPRASVTPVAAAHVPTPPPPAPVETRKEPVVTPPPSVPPAPAPVAPAPVVTRVQPPVAQPAPAPAAKTTSFAFAPDSAPAKGDAKADDAKNVRARYYTVMTNISRYFVVKQYRADYHKELTAELMAISKNTAGLNKEEIDRLNKTIAQMKGIEEKYGKEASAN